jgi:hypothetical protein
MAVATQAKMTFGHQPIHQLARNRVRGLRSSGAGGTRTRHRLASRSSCDLRIRSATAFSTCSLLPFLETRTRPDFS